MSDGQEQALLRYVDDENVLPEEIKSIDYFFTKNEESFHSMVFHGRTTLAIGRTPDQDKMSIEDGEPGLTKGRREVFTVPKGERLLGCEMHHSWNNRLHGISWITITE